MCLQDLSEQMMRPHPASYVPQFVIARSAGNAQEVHWLSVDRP